jgi:tetratricopeptide (TPR) repeat protein
VLVLAACASRAPVIPRLVPQATTAVELSDTPFFPQQAYHCGPAALATVLQASGVSLRPDDLARRVYLPARQGSLQAELVAATRRAARIPYIVEPTLPALGSELDAGRPVLVLQNLAIGWLPVWHYAVVIGLDPDADRVLLRSGTVRRHVVAANEFLRTWQLADKWAMVVLRPGELPAEVDPPRYLEAVALSERYLPPTARVAAYRAALGRWPDNPIARFGLAYALHAAGNLEQAESEYRSLVDGHPGHAVALNNLADVLRLRGCYVDAREAARQAIGIARRDHPGLLEAVTATLDEIPDGADAPVSNHCPADSE